MSPMSRPLRGALADGDRDERGPDDDAERVRGDVVAGGRDVDAGALGDLRQQAHRHELRRADGETAHGEREDGEGRATCWRGSQGFSGFGRSIGVRMRWHRGWHGVVRIAVDPVSDLNGNGGAATVIPMSSTFDRLLGRLRGLVRGPSSPTRPRPTGRPQPAARQGGRRRRDRSRRGEALPRRRDAPARHDVRAASRRPARPGRDRLDVGALRGGPQPGQGPPGARHRARRRLARRRCP